MVKTLNKVEEKLPKIENEIVEFAHCKKCVQEKPNGISLREWQDNEFGWTNEGFQIWCIRHEKNVANYKFTDEGQIVETSLDASYEMSGS